MSNLSRYIPGIALAAGLGVLTNAFSAAQGPAPYTVLSREGRRPLAVQSINGQDMFAVEELARLFNFTTREDTLAAGLTVTVRGQTIVLSPGQELASVAGRLVSLSAPPTRDGRAWFVPTDFLSRALASVAGTRIDVRRPSRLVVVGDIRVPRIGGRLDVQGSLARLTLDIAPTTAHAVTQEGNRLLIRFEADALDASLPPPAGPELIQAIRLEGNAAIVVDLGPRFASFKTSDLPGERGGSRIVLDITATTDPAAPPGQPAPPPQEAPPLLELSPTGGLRSVVVDAGHGGADEGARGSGGSVEKNITLGVARRLKAALEARLGIRVILTRDGDSAVGLDQRAALANNNKADLFISLHANASVRPSATGAEVFYLSLDEYGEEAARAAAAPGETLPVFGGGSRDIEVVPWRLAQARHIPNSAAFARRVEASLRGRVAMSPRALQQAPFRVLVGANMPAVLIEMGFMTNPAQEKQLSSDDYQNALAQSLFDAIVQFRDSRQPAGTAVNRRRYLIAAGAAAALVAVARDCSRAAGQPPGGHNRRHGYCLDRGPRVCGTQDHRNVVLHQRRWAVASARAARGALRRSDHRAGTAHHRGTDRRGTSPARVGDPRRDEAPRPLCNRDGGTPSSISPARSRPGIPAARSTSCSPSTPSSMH